MLGILYMHNEKVWLMYTRLSTYKDINIFLFTWVYTQLMTFNMSRQGEIQDYVLESYL